MMTLLSLTMAAVLLAIAAVHLAWGLGMTWPGHDRQSLIDTVIGHPDVTRMPGFGLCLAVTLALVAAAFWSLWAAELLPLSDASVWGLSVRATGLWVLVAVFLGRGIATYVPSPLAAAVEPFRTLDRRVYAPLCVALGGGFLLLAL